MTLTHYSTRQVGLPSHGGAEVELVRHLVQNISRASICTDHVAVINIYVALKSKPLAILAGPEQSGKAATVRGMAQTMLGGTHTEPKDYNQDQMMEGHPWLAVDSGNVAFFTEIHNRYNSEKLLCLMEEAWRPENSNKVFLACLTRISMAELEQFFTQIAFQLRHGNIMRFGSIHFTKPIPFPPNLFLIGTMDTEPFYDWDNDLLGNTTVIQWQEKPASGLPFQVSYNNLPGAEKIFLRSYVRSEQAVYKKLHSLLGWRRQPVQPLFRVEAIFEKEGIPLPHTLLTEAMTYLANSWSRQGAGLFYPAPGENLATALDLAIAQTYLPRAGRWIQKSKVLQEKLGALLNRNYPRSASALAVLAG